jgi:hypothetical protein
MTPARNPELKALCWNTGRGILSVESWMWNLDRGIMAVGSLLRIDVEIIATKSELRNHCFGNIAVETSGRHREASRGI